METNNTELQNRVQELEEKVKSLDRQIRGRNNTLACVLAAAGGSVRVPASVMKQVFEEFAGASFRTEHDTAANEYVVSAQLLPKGAVHA